MKVVFSILTLLIPFYSIGQYRYDSVQTSIATFESYEDNFKELDIGKFAVSFSPTGFIQFGPVLNFEFSVAQNLVVNTHMRFLRFGLLSYVVRTDPDWPEQLRGMAYGGGVNYFFGASRNKPYVGVGIEYDKSDAIYDKDSSWEWTEVDKTVVLYLNGGYRFRFISGFFINTGASFGMAIVRYDWEYTDPRNGFGGDGNEVNPLGMLDVTFGLEF